MLYFALTLLISLVLSGTLLAGLIISLKINWARQNRRPISFLMPVFLMIVFMLTTLYLTVPRLLDSVYLLNNNYSIEEIQISNGDIGWNSLTDGTRVFFYNQTRFHPENGKTYRISYTPNSLYIVSMTEVIETGESQ